MFPISDNIKSLRFPIFNIAIILVTVVAFILEITSSNPEGFIQTYSLIPADVTLSDITTFIPFFTAIFLHAGFLHILSNMVFLWVFGDNVEGYLPTFVYPLLYFGAGIIGNITQYILSPTSPIPMLGASGAVAGALGAYFVLFPYAKIKTIVPIFFFLTVLNLSAGVMLGYWFILQLISGASALPFSSEQGGVAFFAHIGGFVTGMIVARIFKNASPALEGQVINP